jgi:hypothetical protein
MAEFKLGRIRFVWKGAWYTSALYSVDDVVRYGGRTYICIVNHTSAAEFQDDLTAANWALMSDGQEWKGDWGVNTTYKPNDVVKYGGYIYICNTGHASNADVNIGLEGDLAKWDLFIEGFDYKTDWAISTRYKVNDLVRYGATVYLCVTEHTSASTLSDGLELDLAKWEVFAKGFNWLDTWAINTRYKPNDTVRYGGQLYVCITGHTSAATAADGLELDQAKWQYLHKGIEYLGDWVTATRYKVNDVAKYGANLWIATAAHTAGASLAADEANWDIFIPGLEFEDSWDAATQYQPGDIVTYGGYQYVGLRNNLNKVPSTETADWDIFVTGFSLKGDYNNATAYKTGDVVRVGGTTYIAIADTTGNRPPSVLHWDKLNEGLYWKGTWANANYYDKGDIVRGSVNTDTSYICITSHTANNVGPATINQPDYAPGSGVDTSVWQLLSGGPENDVLESEGDILIYGASGPARLPIGASGQALVVNSAGTLPEWGFVGQVDQVYYVGPNGTDEPAPNAGVTLDRPFRNIRYALHQIDLGPRNPQGVNLLNRNKAFIQDEVIAWIDDQITGNISPFTSAFTYDAVKCRRDIGIIVDATINDLKKGGNVKSREAALSYFTDLGVSYVAGQEAETAAAIVRAAYIAQQVVVNSTGYTPDQATTLQVSDLTKVAEATVVADIETLMTLSSDAITAGVISGIPAKSQPQITLNVKTGIYNEILPMSVAANCAVVGDELRSTNIRPAGSVVSSGDVQYSLQGIQRMEAIISDVIQNIAVTVTPSGGIITVPTGASLGYQGASLIEGTGTVATTASGSGTGATFTLTTNAFGFVTGLTVLTPGQDYVVGETITIPATETINNPGTGDTAIGETITFQVLTVTTGNTITQDVAVPAGSSAAGTAAAAIADNIEKYIDFKINDNGTEPALTGSNTAEVSAGYTDARLRLLANREFIAKECAEFVKRANPGYSFGQNDCEDDIKDYVDGIIYDLQYTGNYMSLKGAKWYVNAVEGSTLSDMFYMRNATGLRNCTVQGLSGALGAANSYGTKRPTAGAFVSLDPGYGTADESVWIGALNGAGGRSPYIQNVTTFGTGAVGQKIDGDLHAGGNDSMVSNDFTQVISDGIGAWITNLGRAELVSVFSYYGHIGYLAETGGKIRATNGNSSYGDFGCVAEGVDPTEIPVTGLVNNRSTDAVIDGVFTDGEQILALEFGNAGREYSNATVTITGDGFGLNTVTATYNTGGVYRIRLTETPASDPSDLGGDGYVTTTNSAQTGTLTQITLAAADSAASAVYVGMALFVTEGKGAGMYGYIDTYTSSSKVATIKKFSDDSAGWDTLGGKTAETLDSTSIYEITPRVVIGAPDNDGSTTPRQAVARAVITGDVISSVKILDCGASYTSAPTVTFVDPNNSVDAPVQAYIGDGVLGQPTYVSRGQDYVTASATVTEQGVQATVSAITQASPAVITTTAAHNFNTNDKVKFDGIIGMTDLNSGVFYYVKVLTTDTFEIYADYDLTVAIDSTAYTAYASGGTAETFGGFRDDYQTGKYIAVENLTSIPRAGSNIEFGHLPGQYFKLVVVNQQLGTKTPFTGLLQVSPDIKSYEAPEHGETVEMRIRYSQVRLTGHDFLDIGTGNITSTNYPGLPAKNPIPANEVVEGGGGRVFFTSTDQDGNFRVGDLFSVEQATGIASLNADAFNISGLQELQLGDLALGGTSASINEFSTDGTMAANSDAIVPTQRAIRTYIASQIGGGASSLNVNLITAGLVVITGNTISTSNNVGINFQSVTNFTKGVTGVPIAMNYLIHS